MSDKVADKVAGIINDVIPVFEQVDDVIRQYTRSTDIYDLELFETVKMHLLDFKIDISNALGQLRYYHIVYDEGRKSKKAEVLQKLLDQKVGSTAAHTLVYDHKEYRDYMKILGRVEEAFHKVQNKYYLIDSVLSGVQQSIANSRSIEKH